MAINNNDKIKLEEIRTAVRGKLDDATYDAVIIDQAANDFQNELFTNRRLRMAEASGTLSVSTGDTAIEFPSDMMTLVELTLIFSVTQHYDLKKSYVDYSEFMHNYAGYAVATAARPSTWTDYGNGIRLGAPSNADYTINIDYLRTPEYMNSDSSESEIRNVWKEMFVLGTLARVMEVNEDYAEASQERDKLSPMLTAFAVREGRGGIKTGPNIMGQGPGRTRSARRDRNF